MSLGSTDPLDRGHLAKLRRLIERTEPGLVSEHLCWSGVGGRALSDLLPCHTPRKRSRMCARASPTVQSFLGRELLVENVSTYLAFADSTIPEWEFVAAVAHRTGCKLLCDVNNIYVNAVNHGFDADAYLRALPPDAIAEIHLAGFDASGPCLVDTHGAPVAPDVWALYRRALARFGPVPTLIERDTDIPPLATLLAEAATAQSMLDTRDAVAA
jgi:uncharacterized protein (UPF0276 family)